MNPSQPIYGGEVLTHNPGNNPIIFEPVRTFLRPRDNQENYR